MDHPAPVSARWPKRLLFGLLCVLFTLPAIQAKFHFVKLGELGGYAVLAPRAYLSAEGLRDNSY